MAKSNWTNKAVSRIQSSQAKQGKSLPAHVRVAQSKLAKNEK